MEENEKKRMIQCFRLSPEDRSLRNWGRVRSPVRVMLNFIIISLCKLLPDMEFKNMLYRRIGIKIGRGVKIMGCSFDVFFPELIEIGDNSVIGSFTVILTHEFLPGEYRKGPVKIGSGVMLGAMSLVLPGVEIGDNAKIAAYSLVNRNVETGSLVGGVPAKPIEKK